MVTESGWQSSYTLPLFWGDGLLGFFFLNSLELATFQPVLLDRIKVSVELLATLLTHEISQLRNLRWLVQILFMLVDKPDPAACGHVERVSLCSRLIAVRLGAGMNLLPNFVEDLCLFPCLHDIGKRAEPMAPSPMG